MADELRLSIEKLIYGVMAWRTLMEIPFSCRMFCLAKRCGQLRKSKKKKLIWAELLEITSPAKERGKAKCAHFRNAAAATTSTFRQRSSCGSSKTFCAKRFRGSAESCGMTPLWNIQPNPMAIETARNGVRSGMLGRSDTSCRKARGSCRSMSVPCCRRASRTPSPSFRRWRAPAGCQRHPGIEAFADSADDKMR